MGLELNERGEENKRVQEKVPSRKRKKKEKEKYHLLFGLQKQEKKRTTLFGKQNTKKLSLRPRKIKGFKIVWKKFTY